jgi:tetratricopeptide (TPR) repeat protein
MDTQKWLDNHDLDTSVRTQYLTFLTKLPLVFDEVRIRAAFKTAEWLKKHPHSFDVCTKYVSFLLAVRHPDLAVLEAESIQHHQWIIEKNPKQVGYHLDFGSQLLRLKKFAEAKAKYEKVLEENREHQLACRGLATAHQNLGEMEEAEDKFKRALFLAKKDGWNLAMFHTSLGNLYLSQERWPKAIKSFNAACEEDSEYFGNHLGIAKAQVGLGKLDEAIKPLERALEYPKLRLPRKDEIKLMLADILQQLSEQLDG